MSFKTRSLVFTLCILSGVISPPILSTAQAGAAPGNPSVTLTKDVTVGAPPSASFAGAASGDGWDILFYRDRIVNVFHHGSQFIVDCHLQADGSHCDTVEGVSPWPKTVTSPAPLSDFTSPAHASGWIDEASGRLYGWTSRSSDGTGGVVCVDLTSSAANPFCGFTPLTAAGDNPESATTAFGGRAIVGSKMYAYDTATGKMLCFSTSTLAACAGQPFALPIGGISPMSGGWTDTTNLAAGGNVFVHVDDDAAGGGVITCFNPQTHAPCAGTWPRLISDSVPGLSTTVGTPFPYLSSNGTVIGVCLPYEGVVPCWDLTGASMVTPAALIDAIGHTDMWNDGAVLGTRVFVPTGEATGTGADAVYCYDFATGAGCPNFPIETTASSYLYTVTPDPVRTGCMWINADNANSGTQIRNFDGFDGTSGCADRVHVTSSVVIPDAGCEALGWSNVQVIDPSPAAYTAATLSLTDTQGNAVAGGTGIAADGTGTFDLSGITIPDAVLYTATFTNPTFSNTGVVFRFTWDSTDASTCVANATTVPGPPTINSLAPNPGIGGLTVALTPPTDPGTSPITSYLYSTDGGATWRARTDGGLAGTSLDITKTSGDGTALVDGTSYDIVLRAVSDVGTGLASNDVIATASVPELLVVPASATTTFGAAGALAPVYIAGLTTNVTVDIATTNGTISVVGNAGLTAFPCTTCSGPSISFGGSQAAVNVALATLVETASVGGSGTVTFSVTKDGDGAPTLSGTTTLTVLPAHLATPAPTALATSTSAVSVSFDPIANAVSYTVRVYAANGTTPVGSPHLAFTSGTKITGLAPNTTYKFTVTAVGDTISFSNSAASARASATTQSLPIPPPPPPPVNSCRAPRPSQALIGGVGTMYAVRTNATLAVVPNYAGDRSLLSRPLIRAVATASGHGSWSLGGDGGIFTAGDAPFAGTLARRNLPAPVTDIAGTPCVNGYDVLSTDGHVFTFGAAKFYGSMRGTVLNQPMTGLALTCSGRGYYMTAADGGVFTFGDARFHGSLARMQLTSPISEIVTNCANSGYWLVAADGGVFTAGKAGFYGSLGATKGHAPIVALLPTPTFRGYWLVASDGKTYPFGDARR